MSARGGYIEKTSGVTAMQDTPTKDRAKQTHDIDRDIAKGNDLTSRFIGGATVGAFAGGLFSAGAGILPGAVIGGVTGAVTSEVFDRWSGSRKRKS